MNTFNDLQKILVQPNPQFPILIAGPCSAESEIQVIETALALQNKRVHVLRAGIWKPRTRPNCFEGVGKIGLKWLNKAKELTGMKTATEVANRAQVLDALEAEIDILWIGARTSVSPFAVQEIADTLKNENVDVPVLVKNPINPDLNLWIGALERIHQAGIKKLGAIHRGFSCYGKSSFRNTPLWQIPLELKRRFPQLPIICDPSHICGNRERIQEISQESLKLGFNGLMIESHINPEEALSDAQQQLKPRALINMLKELKLKEFDIDEQGIVSALEGLRGQIDVMDNDIIQALADRMKISKEIGKHKKKNKMPVLQSDRWEQVVQMRSIQAQNKGLTQDFINNVLNAIHRESISHQEEIMQ